MGSNYKETDFGLVQDVYVPVFFFYIYKFYFILFIFFISWRLTTTQYCSDFCHTLTRISHGFTCRNTCFYFLNDMS